MVRCVWIDRQIEGEDVKELERERVPGQSESSESAPVYVRWSFKISPPHLFHFFLSGAYKELFKPWYRHTEQAFILGRRERGGWGASVTLETRTGTHGFSC